MTHAFSPPWDGLSRFAPRKGALARSERRRSLLLGRIQKLAQLLEGVLSSGDGANAGDFAEQLLLTFEQLGAVFLFEALFFFFGGWPHGLGFLAHGDEMLGIFLELRPRRFGARFILDAAQRRGQLVHRSDHVFEDRLERSGFAAQSSGCEKPDRENWRALPRFPHDALRVPNRASGLCSADAVRAFPRTRQLLAAGDLLELGAGGPQVLAQLLGLLLVLAFELIDEFNHGTRLLAEARDGRLDLLLELALVLCHLFLGDRLLFRVRDDCAVEPLKPYALFFDLLHGVVDFFH